MKTKFLLLLVVLFSMGCSTTSTIARKIYVFPELPNMYSVENLSLADMSTVLVKPVSIENIPDKQYSIYFSEVLINALNKLNIIGILVEDQKNIDVYKKKYQTAVICDIKFMYQYNPETVAASSSVFANRFAGSGSGDLSAKGNYFKFIGATCKLKDIGKDKILFSDEISHQDTESKAIKRIAEHLAICIAKKDVDTFKKIFLKNIATENIVRENYEESVGSPETR
jgi:hypothetical protein